MSLLIVILLGLAILTVVLAHLLQFAVEQYTARVEPTDIIMNVPLNDVYMKRWVIYPKIDTKKSKWDPKHKFAIIINRFYGPDLDPPHNHMSWSVSLAVEGLGYERSPGKKDRMLWPFTFRFRSSSFRHCIDSFSQVPLTTIFIAGLNKDSKWGFWEDGKFTEAKAFKGTKAFKH